MYISIKKKTLIFVCKYYVIIDLIAVLLWACYAPSPATKSEEKKITFGEAREPHNEEIS